METLTLILANWPTVVAAATALLAVLHGLGYKVPVLTAILNALARVKLGRAAPATAQGAAPDAVTAMALLRRALRDGESLSADEVVLYELAQSLPAKPPPGAKP